MFKWIRSAIDRLRGTQTRGLALVSNWLAGQLWNIDTIFNSLAKEAYSKNEVIYGCIRTLAGAVPEPPLVAYQVTDDNRQTPLPPSHPLSRLIKRPNELMTEYEFWELVTIHMAIVGRSCWWKERDRIGRLIGLWPMRPDRVGPVYSDSQNPGERVLWGWSYQIPGSGNVVPIERKHVLTLNFPDPAGESGGIVEGLGPAMAVARQVASDNEATKFVGALLANYAAPTVALRLKARINDEAEADLIKAKFRYEFGGANRGTPALVDAETEIQIIGFNLEELEFPELREVSESRIAAAFGVPAILVGLRAGLKFGDNRASVSEQRSYFTETTLSNYWRRFQEQYTEDIGPEFGSGIVCEFDLNQVKALAVTRAAVIAPVKAAYESGAVTVNEYRTALRLPVVDGGDVFRVPTSTIEVGIAVDETTVRPLTMGAKALRAASEEPEREADERETQLALEVALTSLAALSLSALQRRLLPSDDDINREFRQVLEPRLIDIATTSFIRLAERMGVQYDIATVSRSAASWARSYTFDLVAGLSSTTREVLQDALNKFISTPNMTVEELRHLIEPAFGAVRAEMIASTETTRAIQWATNEYQAKLAERGIPSQRIWYTARDERVCPVCGPLHNKPEAIWVGDYPLGPPIHTRCRCHTTLIPDRQKAYVLEVA